MTFFSSSRQHKKKELNSDKFQMVVHVVQGLMENSRNLCVGFSSYNAGCYD